MEELEETVETLNNEQEKLKTRLGNVQKLASVLSSAMSKHKRNFNNYDDNKIQRITTAVAKVRHGNNGTRNCHIQISYLFS